MWGAPLKGCQPGEALNHESGIQELGKKDRVEPIKSATLGGFS
jgi:hypothetical protein